MTTILLRSSNGFRRFVRSTKPAFLLTKTKRQALWFDPSEAEKQANIIRQSIDRVEFADVVVEVTP
ncbi:MAG: hypothetical protein WC911_02080 [Thermoleophilia bacterium]